MDIHFKRIRRILSCNIESLTPAEGKELTELIEKKVKANADSKTKAKPSSASGNSGAAV